jgi:hypothetical protein
MEVSRSCFSIPDWMGDCKVSAFAIASRAAEVKQQIGMPLSSSASGKGGARGIGLDLWRGVE